ncbi:DNA recombination protein RmuC [Candidatus Blochmannia ocreatus (nom. nud.)]|uniref:DNA recombination protein RmuC n=1 Tax=Candidatus Blochmannia ocreatus (nom. nud.) TaxID=251538 RepID=A0ABY4SUL3_9ENTR|nr:DNA recombination protein RmuC [Candidatus Blochmannia ocreatus]URJ25089.1 DNA recombination protein RmuC [Candidatus Blochmannia ocreatus]
MNIPIYFYDIINIFIGFIITGIFSVITVKIYIKKYKKNYLNHKKILSISTENLKNESNLRQNTEKKLQHTLQTVCELHGKLSTAEEKLKLFNCYYQKYEKLNVELQKQMDLNHIQALKIKELSIRLEEHKISTEEKQKLFIDNEHKLTIQIENLANRIFEKNRSQLETQNKLSLENILSPLQIQLDIFKKQMQNNFNLEEKTTHSLTYEIRTLHQLNAKITQETVNLTQALKGNNKIQGNWGEVILTRALESSGMREGYEFHIQNSIKHKDGYRLQPDVVIHLPKNKKVIIDSKVSLIAYERYFNSTNKEEKRLAITDHINSIRNHIKSLNKKDYQKLFELNTLDYILMFIPIESAFILAIKTEPSLLTDAMKRNIMLTSPTTLLIALRTINNLWQYEYQNCYAKKIADKASNLYDKLRLFIDDLNKIGVYLHKAETVYNAAKNKFSEGKGNIISKAESFKALGVQIKQPIITTTTPSHKESHDNTCITSTYK